MADASYMGGKHHVELTVITWPQSLVLWLPLALAVRIVALWMLQARATQRLVPTWTGTDWLLDPEERREPHAGLFSTLLRLFEPLEPRGLALRLPDDELTFTFPPTSALVWEVLDTAGHVRPYHANRVREAGPGQTVRSP